MNRLTTGIYTCKPLGVSMILTNEMVLGPRGWFDRNLLSRTTCFNDMRPTRPRG